MILIGDAHGHLKEYINKVKDHPYSLCLGDVGFDYSELKELDPERHKIVAGNHENYARLSPHFLGDYGVWQNIFYVRGAYSIDKAWRKEYIDWFPEEEIDYAKLSWAISYYKNIKPDIVCTHDCPASLKEILIGEKPTDRTSRALQEMFEKHQPKVWCYGHHHQSLVTKVGRTLFICLNELEVYNLDNQTISQ